MAAEHTPSNEVDEVVAELGLDPRGVWIPASYADADEDGLVDGVAPEGTWVPWDAPADTIIPAEDRDGLEPDPDDTVLDYLTDQAAAQNLDLPTFLAHQSGDNDL